MLVALSLCLLPLAVEYEVRADKSNQIESISVRGVWCFLWELDKAEHWGWRLAVRSRRESRGRDELTTLNCGAVLLQTAHVSPRTPSVPEIR